MSPIRIGFECKTEGALLEIPLHEIFLPDNSFTIDNLTPGQETTLKITYVDDKLGAIIEEYKLIDYDLIFERIVANREMCKTPFSSSQIKPGERYYRPGVKPTGLINTVGNLTIEHYQI